tara:strand:+ start:1468 stop:1677 length:210 start_codon:yes stop_codon:yes gene_type:complete
MKYNNNDIYNRLTKLENSIKKIDAILTNFMNDWGPEAQKKRAEIITDYEKWDEMVRVLSIQNRNDGELL